MDMQVKKVLYHYVNGKRVEGKSARYGDIYNPALGVVTKQAPYANAEEVSAAIEVAAAALPEWSATPPGARAQVMFAFREIVRKNIDQLAAALSAEHGKTIEDAKGSIGRGPGGCGICLWNSTVAER